MQLLMEADVAGRIDARRYERTTWRNAHRGPGSLQLRTLKLRQGSYLPPFLERETYRRRR